MNNLTKGSAKNYDQRVMKVLELLDVYYYDQVKCFLNHETPWQLLIATMLSAQCTDDRVNIVTETLFRKYGSLKDLIEAPLSELEQDIRSTGFYHNKAMNIQVCARQLLEHHNGIVPSDIDELTALRGVGRKTANVVRGNIYKIPSVVVDTHVKRISYKLGFTEYEDPVKIEFQLMDVLPETHWISYNTQIIAHGRKICKARNPDCENCFLLPYCPTGLNNRYSSIGG
ncbi:MAG: endonuclease III [Vallitaleaceae bacterium]|jgi:endonuclease-3|nr:endonuclease III [Vallitaleaceae bacterium]